MIAGITLYTGKNELFTDFLYKMNPRPDYWFLFCDNKRINSDNVNAIMWRVANNYNKIKETIPKDVEYVFILEDDVIPPYNILDILKSDIDINKCDIITTSVPVRNENNIEEQPMVWDFNPNLQKLYKPCDNCMEQTYGKCLNVRYDNCEISPVDASSLGCVLLKKEILDKITFYGMNKLENLMVDSYFFIMAKQLGYSMMCDFSISINHNGTNIHN